MPVAISNFLSLRSLQAYAALSILIISGSLYYAMQVTLQPEWRSNWTSVLTDKTFLLSEWPDSRSIRGIEILYFMIQEPLCLWTLVNMAYCCLLLFGKIIQKIVFGDLRVSEQQHIKDKFWNFVFYKFIFIFGVLNVRFMFEMLMWCGWFSVLGFLHIFAQLCKDRCDYVCFSPATPKWTHIKLMSLLLSIFLVATSLLILCIFVGFTTSFSTFAFMSAECLLLMIRALYVITRYAIHQWDINHNGIWENRLSYMYYSELAFEVSALSVDLLHHVHMLIWSNIVLSMASLIMFMQLRFLFNKIQRRVSKHKEYLKVLQHMETNYPMATSQEIENNSDDCAICWEKLETARKLPCSHLFHNSCLQSWLEQDTSCPTCRTSLLIEQQNNDAGTNDNSENALHNEQNISDTPTINRTTINHFFHFDGSRYISWFPSFSVEVTHSQILSDRNSPAVSNSQLDSMVTQVQQMFPALSAQAITDDLRQTRSMEITVENILEGRLVSSSSSNSLQAQSQSDISPYSTENPSASGESTFNVEDSSQIVSLSEPVETESSSSHANDVRHNKFFIDEAIMNPLYSSDEDSDNRADQHYDRSQMLNDSHSNLSTGSRFSKSATERQSILADRKMFLLNNARKRYLTKQRKLPNEDSYNDVKLSETSSKGNVRNLAYEAAQRRINNQST